MSVDFSGVTGIKRTKRQRTMPRGAARARQRGVAIITALLLTALAITIVASLFWQQQVQVRSMENQRLHLQTKWILRGALDYARFVLREDYRTNNKVTALNGIWATPLAETRLDDYVERERVEGDNYNATLSGEIVDAQARYNLTNLAKNRVVDTEQVAAFQRLLTNVQLDTSLAQATAQAIAKSEQLATSSTGTGVNVGDTTTGSGTGTGSGANVTNAAVANDGSEPMPFMQLEDLLSVAGFTPPMVQKLRDYVTVLPAPTKLNINTAPAEAIAAVANVSVSEASALVASRTTAAITNASDLSKWFSNPNNSTSMMDVKSSYFLVRSRIRLDRAALDAESLIQRQTNNLTTTTLISIREI